MTASTASASPAEAASSTQRRGQWASLRRADFPAALSAPVQAKSPHFVLHHLAGPPMAHARTQRSSVVPEISTAAAPSRGSSVDISTARPAWWLGLVVPKRHARRSVTRNLIKRQIREEARARRERLPAGQWLVRLRAPFDPRLYPSAASAELRAAARRELEQVFACVVKA